MYARISILGADILCECDGMKPNESARIPITEKTLDRLNHWKIKYKQAVRSNNPDLLPIIGGEIFEWLDESGWASKWFKGIADRVLEIAVEDPDSEAASALLDLPWEILAYKGDYLAGDSTQLFEVFRSIGRDRNAAPAQPIHRDLALIFMAASPEGVQELNFEEEEAAILDATRRLPVQLVVEESGCAEFLKDRLALDGQFEAVHISCHGDILKNLDPILALESPEGDLDPITPGDLAETLGEKKPPLVFLSACMTAATGSENSTELTEPFVRRMIRTGIPNVLGWDGSVNDADAILFAKKFYGELAKRRTIPYAAATARREILRVNINDPQMGRHWHLARVYAGPEGAGPCCDSKGKKRHFRQGAGYAEFIDKANKRVRVASAREFVGRRRQAQSILRAFRDNSHSGVLIFGMGDSGKSSLAARIANRMPKHQTVLVFERYDALAIFEQLTSALPPGEREQYKKNWVNQIIADNTLLANAIEEMLKGPLDENPILLIIDDLEQILENPKPGQMITPVKDASGKPDAWRASLSAVLRGFKASQSQTESRLLLTSRYDFTLPDAKGGDLANALMRLQLIPMKDMERIKQLRAAKRISGRAEESEHEGKLEDLALKLAGGNPGLQEILCRPILSGELEPAQIALNAVEHWKSTGEVPSEENKALEFFKRVAFKIYENALTDDQRGQLRAATLFSEGLPIPVAALKAAGFALAVENPSACLKRLTGLGLVDDWSELYGVAHAAANPLAIPLSGKPLTDEEEKRLASAAIIPLAEAWRNEKGNFPMNLFGFEAGRLALIGDAPAEILDAAASAAGNFLFHLLHNAKAALNNFLQPALAKIEEMGALPTPGFLLLAANCAERIGERKLQLSYLEKGLYLKSDDKIALAQIMGTYAEATFQEDPEKSLKTLREAADIFNKEGDVRERAVTMGQIADVLYQRGELDEALRIRREELLPVFEKLGDVHSRAVTMGKIADVLFARGDLDEALRIRREELFPVFEKLGDVRSRAVTMGKIADVLYRRGDLDEALRIRREEQLPVFEKLGDVRSRAVTMGKIADILFSRGELDEALRIRREEELPVYEKLGDVRSRAVTMGKIADILFSRGELDEALRIRREEELPVYEKLGDVRERAVTMGKIADVLYRRGDLDEALRIRREEQLPVYEKLGDVRERAVTMGKIADVLEARGDLDEALRIRRVEQLPVYEKLGDIDNIAVTFFKMARIEWQQEKHKEAFEHFLKSYELNLKLRRLEGICHVGLELGQILCAIGKREEGLQILERSRNGFRKLGQSALADQTQAIIDQINNSPPQ